MGRKSKLQKSSQELTNLQETAIAKSYASLQAPHVQSLEAPLSEHFVLTPSVDYDNVASQIAKLEDLGKEHPMSRMNVAPSAAIAPSLQASPSSATHQPFLATTANFTAAPSALHTPVGSDLTGRQAVGPRIAPIPTEKQQAKINYLSEPIQKIEEDPNLPPLHDDFLAFLIEKQPLSFGWVVDNTFLANFDIRPDLFDSSEKFIFWIVPANINIFKISSAGGFQKSESRTMQVHPHIFFIKILEIPEGHEEEDPFTGIINDVRYINLRETLEKRGIQFVYDHSASRMWVSVLCNRLKIK